MVVTTNLPSGETCDMNDARRLGTFASRTVGQRITSWLRSVVSLPIDTRAYSALSFCGPSTSSPSVFPSRGNEWQFAHVARPSVTTLLDGSFIQRSRHLIKPTAL